MSQTTFSDTLSDISSPPATLVKRSLKERLDSFPWWFVALILILVATYTAIILEPTYAEAFAFIKAGLGVTVKVTLWAFGIAILLGLIAGMGRISRNIVSRNLATLYVEFVRGVPMLVLIFFIALVAVPVFVTGINNIGNWLESLGWQAAAVPLQKLDGKSVDMTVRAVVALSITYGAFLAEIFRAGIQSVDKGQMEAARSQGMSHIQAMYYIIMPQAIRNVLPALGNDFIALLKDSSLVSVLAVREITQIAKLYGARTFRFPEAYTITAILYLTITLVLSLLVKLVERRTRQDER
jgi:polar amino acid transport system permease protein